MVMLHHTGGEMFSTCGFTACSIFFMISGFGMTLSMRKAEPLQYNYLWRSLNKLLKPFPFLWIVSLPIIICMGGGNFHHIKEFLSLGFPNLSGWFYREIVILYLMYFFVKKYIRYDMFAMFTIVLVFVSLTYGKWVYYWYNSTICFPIGIILACYYDLIVKYRKYIVLVFTITMICSFTMLTSNHGSMWAIWGGLSFALVVCLLSDKMCIDTKMTNYIGDNSLQFYMFHMIPCFYLPIPYVNNIVFSIEVIVITFLIVFVYDKILTLCRRK